MKAAPAAAPAPAPLLAPPPLKSAAAALSAAPPASTKLPPPAASTSPLQLQHIPFLLVSPLRRFRVDIDPHPPGRLRRRRGRRLQRCLRVLRRMRRRPSPPPSPRPRRYPVRRRRGDTPFETFAAGVPRILRPCDNDAFDGPRLSDDAPPRAPRGFVVLAQRRESLSLAVERLNGGSSGTAVPAFARARPNARAAAARPAAADDRSRADAAANPPSPRFASGATSGTGRARGQSVHELRIARCSVPYDPLCAPPQSPRGGAAGEEEAEAGAEAAAAMRRGSLAEIEVVPNDAAHEASGLQSLRSGGGAGGEGSERRRVPPRVAAQPPPHLARPPPSPPGAASREEPRRSSMLCVATPPAARARRSSSVYGGWH